MKKIIVPIDFSKHSEYALKTAALLAKDYDATVYVLHMLDIQEISLSESETYQQEKALFFLKLAEKKFNNFLIKDYLEGVKIIPIIKHYKVFSEVNSIALEVGADLIIMGSHGASGLKEFFVGSNTEKVVRYANLPVLVIKNEIINTDFSDIVVATDFSEESIPAYNKMIKALDFLNAQKHILYVNLPNENFKTTSEMESMANNFLVKDYLEGIKVVPIIKHYKVFSEVNAIALEVDADLIIMGSHGASGLKEFFVGSNTEKVVRYANLPVLVIKNEIINTDFSDIVVATDFSEESIHAFNRMIKALDFLNARKHILYVNLPNEDFKTTSEMESMANNFLMKAEGDAHRLINVNYVCDRSVEKGILNFSNAVGADLISVVTHGRKGLSHIFAGSIAEDLTNHSTLPIITLKI